MAKLKTQVTSVSPMAFLASVEPETKRIDSLALLKIFKEATGLKPKLWGASMVGFGSYHYKSERSPQEGDWPLTGFSPRKQNLTIYIMPGFEQYKSLLTKLGKYKLSEGSCMYIKKLADVDVKILAELITQSVADMRKKYHQ